jgi:hypothetical protein
MMNVKQAGYRLVQNPYILPLEANVASNAPARTTTDLIRHNSYFFTLAQVK